MLKDAYSILETCGRYSFWVSLVLLPFLLIRRLRGVLTVTVQYLTYIWGLDLWVNSFIYLLLNYGHWPVIIGCLLFGVGIVPVAIFMAFIHHHGAEGWPLTIALGLLLVVRMIALWAKQSVTHRGAMLFRKKSEDEKFYEDMDDLIDRN